MSSNPESWGLDRQACRPRVACSTSIALNLNLRYMSYSEAIILNYHAIG
jgi:hypothetical protein